MTTINLLSSACRYCQYYKPEGRRGGICKLLGVPVQGSWKACHLSIPAFAPSWEGLEGIMLLTNETSVLSGACPQVYELNDSSLAASEPMKNTVLA